MLTGVIKAAYRESILEIITSSAFDVLLEPEPVHLCEPVLLTQIRVTKFSLFSLLFVLDSWSLVGVPYGLMRPCGFGKLERVEAPGPIPYY